MFTLCREKETHQLKKATIYGVLYLLRSIRNSWKLKTHSRVYKTLHISYELWCSLWDVASLHGFASLIFGPTKHGWMLYLYNVFVEQMTTCYMHPLDNMLDMHVMKMVASIKKYTKLAFWPYKVLCMSPEKWTYAFEKLSGMKIKNGLIVILSWFCGSEENIIVFGMN